MFAAVHLFAEAFSYRTNMNIFYKKCSCSEACSVRGVRIPRFDCRAAAHLDREVYWRVRLRGQHPVQPLAPGSLSGGQTLGLKAHSVLSLSVRPKK